jgi:4-amino-4-deoxy-L-arabinose transferase-like glycosyltransferase
MPGLPEIRRFVAAHERWVLFGATVVAAALVVFPLLGKFGLWDPHELTIADQARLVAKNGTWLETWKSQPPLTLWLIALSTKILGTSEFAARLPFALLGMAAAMATYSLGVRMRGPRVGAFAALVLIASPLFVFQSRQLMSDIAVVAGSSLAALGLVGLAWPKDGRPLAIALDVARVLIGCVLGVLASGMVLGVLVPVGAAGGAALIGVFGRFREGTEPEDPARVQLRLAAAIVLGVAAVAALVIPLLRMVHFADGKLQIVKEYMPILGGQWRPGDAPANATFDYVINQVAFGMFPWSALAPIAVLRLVLVKKRDRGAWNGVFLVLWALLSYAIATFWMRRFSEPRYPALGAIALAVGLLLDDLLRAKADEHAGDEPTIGEGWPIAAVFTALAGFILSLDTRWFPDELASVHLAGRNIHMPTEVKFLPVTVIFGVIVAGAAAVGLFVKARPKLVRRTLYGALGMGWAFALFLSLVYTPKLSQHFSYKSLFQSYFDHRRGDEALAVMGIPGTGAEYYARGKFERFEIVAQMLSFLRSPERVFAIVPADRLCNLRQEAGSNDSFKVLDNESSRFLLLTNKLENGESDQNPLIHAYLPGPPAHMDREIGANFEDTIELLGADMPQRVGRGEKFKVTFYYKVNKKPPQNYKVFVHFDSSAGVRFQGDHDPIGGRCGATFWQPGDIIADTFEVEAGSLTSPKGPYTVLAGFFTGGGGVYKNMTVLTPNKDSNNRVSLGTFVVD